MQCSEVQKILNEYHEDELPENLRAGIEAHLSACAECRAEQELIIKSWQMLDLYKAPEIRDGFTETLLKKIHSEQLNIQNKQCSSNYVIWFKSKSFIASMAFACAIFVMLFVSGGRIFKNNENSEIALNAEHSKETNIAMLETSIEQKPLLGLSDEEIIENLNILENIELLENLDLIADLKAVEEFESDVL
ncbi:MAG: zf-HC2 domain-containing protein [Alphaproteobacteria bacterium]|nr:zf-HC2 domain-containing protein [Alphaproteobacteria bacterium]